MLGVSAERSLMIAVAAGMLLVSVSCASSHSPRNAEHPAPAPVQAASATPGLAALATETEEVSPTPTSTLTATPVPPTETATPSRVGPQFPEGTDPLSGLSVGDPALLHRRPVAVKVSNFPRSLRPQSGLSIADLVFEYYTEEGMSRFLAIYLGHDDPKVGPVRSARYVDAELVTMYQAVLGFVRADPMVWAHVAGALGDRAISESPSTCPALCRSGNGDVNSVFADTAAFTALSRSQGQHDLGGMVFQREPPSGGQPGSRVLVVFSWGTRAEWRYAPAGGTYQRWSDSLPGDDIVMVPLTDRNTGEQIQALNVAVLYAWYNRLSGNEKYDVEFLYRKRGRVQLFRDGMVYEGFWVASSPSSPLQFVDASGAPLPLHPGNTWLEVVGEYSAGKQVKPGEWEVDFGLP
jgi:hypothetical protein